MNFYEVKLPAGNRSFPGFLKVESGEVDRYAVRKRASIRFESSHGAKIYSFRQTFQYNLPILYKIYPKRLDERKTAPILYQEKVALNGMGHEPTHRGG